MNLDWLLGYLEGQGSFSIVLKKSGDRMQVVADFSVKGDKDLLERVAEYIGGKVYRKGGSYVLKVTKLNEAAMLVRMLEHKIKSEVNKDTFGVWKECVCLMENGEHLTKEGMLKIATLRNSLHGKDKWNKKSFCEIRTKVDPCEIYKKLGKIPEGCKICGGCQ